MIIHKLKHGTLIQPLNFPNEYSEKLTEITPKIREFKLKENVKAVKEKASEMLFYNTDQKFEFSISYRTAALLGIIAFIMIIMLITVILIAEKYKRKKDCAKCRP
jgi:hypothetical protein